MDASQQLISAVSASWLMLAFGVIDFPAEQAVLCSHSAQITHMPEFIPAYLHVQEVRLQ